MLVDVASAAMGAIMVGVKTISFSMYPTVETVPDVTQVVFLSFRELIKTFLLSSNKHAKHYIYMYGSIVLKGQTCPKCYWWH